MITTLLLTSLLNTADAVPLQLTQQGRVLDNNGSAVSGAHDLTFRIYDASTGGSVYWSETLTVNFTNGYYAAVLGADEQNNALDSNTLSLYPLYLEVQLDNNAPMTTRYEITSAPFAQMAGNAEVAESVDGGTVNASEVQINAVQVIDGNGNWVGQPITVDWNNIDPNTIPSYIADGDDNTQLSEGQVEQYVTNDIINLASGSQAGGSDIVTVATDSDTLAGLSCTSGEIAGWNGSAWTCVSDNTLTVSDVSTMLTNNAVDLNTSTTIGGLAIITEIDDADTLANLSCANDGEIARYDLVLDEWYCDADIDTVLDENTVETYVTNGAIDLDANTTIGGNPILTSTTDSDTLNGLNCSNGQIAKYDSGNGAWICGDDNNTQLSQSEVLNNINGQQLALGAGTTVGGSNVLTQPNACTDGQVLVYNLSTASWACGADTDTTLSASEVQAMVEAVSGLALQAGTTVGGSPVLTEGSTIDVGQLDGTSGSTGQVLMTDGSTVSWGDASGGDCTEAMVNHSDGSFYVTVDCGTYSYVLKTGGATNFWSSQNQCSISYLEYDNNGVISLVDCGNSSHVVHGANTSNLRATKLSSGRSSTICAINETDSIECWGDDTYGQNSNVPSGTFSEISVGWGHVCAINATGQVQCWGQDQYGEVSNVPNFLFTSISVGDQHSCGIDTTGQVHCWGRDNWGQVTNVPNNTISSISSGGNFICGILTSQSVQCWGYNNYGIQNTPSGSFTKIDVSKGNGHACGIKSDGTIECWGRDNLGQVSGSPSGTFTDIKVGSSHSCGINIAGGVECWGDDSYGQISDVPSGTFTQLISGDYDLCAINHNGEIQCWGSYYNLSIYTPTGTFGALGLGYGHVCGIHTLGNVICLGENNYGLADNVP